MMLRWLLCLAHQLQAAMVTGYYPGNEVASLFCAPMVAADDLAFNAGVTKPRRRDGGFHSARLIRLCESPGLQ